MGLADMNGKTIKVSGYYIGASSSRYVNVMAVAVEEIPVVADPEITCTEDGEVEITCETEGATIYYTEDGTDPSASNGTSYTGKFSVASGTTVKAVGVKEGYANSAFVSYTYTKVSQNAVTIVLSAAERPCDNFPNTSAGVTTTTTYTIGGYEWTFSPSSGNKFSWYKDQKYILWGKQGGYILLPAVEGKKLTKVTILTGKGASTKVNVGVFNAEGTAAVTGGEAIQLNKQNAEFSWNLSETEVNTHYQLRVTSAHNAQLQTLTCIYE